jgi:hypothetical protein
MGKQQQKYRALEVTVFLILKVGVEIEIIFSATEVCIFARRISKSICSNYQLAVSNGL